MGSVVSAIIMEGNMGIRKNTFCLNVGLGPAPVPATA